MQRDESRSAGKQCRTADDFHRNISKAFAELLRQTLQVVGLVRKDAFPVVHSHQTFRQAAAIDAALQQSGTEKNGVWRHQCFHMIQDDALRYD